MAFWFYRGLRRGIATTRYPDKLDPWARALPSAPSFHSAHLTSELVDRLSEMCPAGALARVDRELVVDLGRCSACGRCLDAGGGAVQPSGEFLLASADRAALVKRVPIRGEARHGRQ
ncbi:MAG TPA: hypothetical protein VME22_28660 [Solirubrobacteraceae bacterium]|nr:hypothetical protein [Solirubrobacteraceae bacterium]